VRLDILQKRNSLFLCFITMLLKWHQPITFIVSSICKLFVKVGISFSICLHRAMLGIIFFTTYFTICWDSKLWLVQHRIYMDPLLTPLLLCFSYMSSSTCQKGCEFYLFFIYHLIDIRTVSSVQCAWLKV